MEKKENNIVQLKPEVLQRQVTIAVREVEAHYTNATQVYMEGLSHYTLHIAKLKSQIETLEDENKEQEKVLKPLNDDIRYNERLLERLNEAFTQQVVLLEALDEEYAQIVEKETQKKIVSKKQKELTKLLDELEALEINILNQELQRLNLLAILEPKQRQIRQLQAQIKELEIDKEHFETTKLPTIGYLGEIAQSIVDDAENVVDIDVLEEETPSPNKSS